MLQALDACRALNVSITDYDDWQNGALVKVAVNCAVNAATALIAAKNGALLSATALPFLSAVLDEVAAVFAAYTSSGLSSDALSRAQLLQTTRDMITTTQHNVSSTLGDVRRVQALALEMGPATENTEAYTELEHMNGFISRLCRRYNVPTPLNDALLALVETKCQALVRGLR